MSKPQYRITATYTQRFVLEGEGDLPFAERRVEEILSGLLHEDDNEVSSYRESKPVVKLEVCLNEEEDLWRTVSRD